MADRAHSTSRRALLAGLMTPAALTMPAPATPPVPSDLAAACAWAMAREDRIDALCTAEGWPSERLHAEWEPCRAVWARAIAEPSASLGDLTAKARLLLADMARHRKPVGKYDDERLADAILRDVVALGGAA